MGNKRISVESVKKGPDQVQLIVVAWDTQEVEGKPQEVPLGEKVLAFPGGAKTDDMLDAIRKAGEEIEEAADQAKELRTELNKRLQKGVE